MGMPVKIYTWNATDFRRGTVPPTERGALQDARRLKKTVDAMSQAALRNVAHASSVTDLKGSANKGFGFEFPLPGTDLLNAGLLTNPHGDVLSFSGESARTQGTFKRYLQIGAQGKASGVAVACAVVSGPLGRLLGRVHSRSGAALERWASSVRRPAIEATAYHEVTVSEADRGQAAPSTKGLTRQLNITADRVTYRVSEGGAFITS